LEFWVLSFASPRLSAHPKLKTQNPKRKTPNL
jgi:hypothetical protein